MPAAWYTRCDLDSRTHCYVLGRYQYSNVTVPFDEANILARGTGVESDASGALTWGRSLLLEKKDKVRLREYRERCDDQALVMPRNDARPPLVDVLHRLLWLAEHTSLEVFQLLVQAQPDAAQLRLVVQALADRALAAESTTGPCATLAPLNRLPSPTCWRRGSGWWRGICL